MLSCDEKLQKAERGQTLEAGRGRDDPAVNGFPNLLLVPVLGGDSLETRWQRRLRYSTYRGQTALEEEQRGHPVGHRAMARAPSLECWLGGKGL